MKIASPDNWPSLGYTSWVGFLCPCRSDFNPEKANELMKAAQQTPADLNSNFDKGYELLKKEPTVNPAQIRGHSYGFGGGLVLDQARLGKISS